MDNFWTRENNNNENIITVMIIIRKIRIETHFNLDTRSKYMYLHPNYSCCIDTSTNGSPLYRSLLKPILSASLPFLCRTAVLITTVLLSGTFLPSHKVQSHGTSALRKANFFPVEANKSQKRTTGPITCIRVSWLDLDVTCQVFTFRFSVSDTWSHCTRNYVLNKWEMSLKRRRNFD